MRGWNGEEAELYARNRLASPADEVAAKLGRGGDRVLELGCGPGLVAGKLAPSLLVCSDLTLPFLGHARVNAPGSTVLCTDAASLPFREDSFDTVMALAVLHHLDGVQLQRALRESFRVLVPRGRFVLLEDWAFTDPTAFEKTAMSRRFRGAEPEHHLRFSGWDREFRKAGFTLLERHWPERPFRIRELEGRVRMMAALYGRDS